jgi:ABC-type glutathione transport system ATPase component
LTTSAAPEGAHDAHHHDHEIAGPAITAEGLREHAATHAQADVPDVHIKGVTKRFGDVIAVDGMDLVVARGSFYSLLGPSCCG